MSTTTSCCFLASLEPLSSPTSQPNCCSHQPSQASVCQSLTRHSKVGPGQNWRDRLSKAKTRLSYSAIAQRRHSSLIPSKQRRPTTSIPQLTERRLLN